MVAALGAPGHRGRTLLIEKIRSPIIAVAAPGLF
jgi:hypothetical protein